MIYEEAKEIQDQLVTWRRALHQMPELGCKLPETTAYIAGELEKMGISHQVYPEISCITALIGNGPKCILLRSDTDGLPLTEKSGESFASTNGCAHACGHDLHAATLLGAAKLLKKHEKELNATVKLLFQPGEETFEGAQAAIRAGVMKNPEVDAAFAMHVFAGMDLGSFYYGDVPMGAVYGFRITVKGKGGHGSQPENCIDPINAGVQIYLALQSLIARETSPLQNASLTIGSFQAGAAANAIPDTAVLMGTLRTFDSATRAMLIQRISAISEQTAAAYRCGFSLDVLSDVPSLTNDPAFSSKCFASLKKAGVLKELHKDLKVMGSEDFAFFSQKVPSCYLVAGAGVEDKARRRGQHNPEIVFNEDALAQNAAAYAQVALDWGQAPFTN
ncbi:MAG: M20 family metallopeptidase [Bilifractor sp.]